MKKKKYTGGICVLAVCLLFASCTSMTLQKPTDLEPDISPIIQSGENYEPGEAPESMQLVTQNGHLAMFADLSNGSFAIEDMRSQTYWYSNPIDREEDEIAAGTIKKWLSSQILVNDVVLSSKTVKTKSSYVASERQGGIRVELEEKGIRVWYHFVKEEYTIPVVYTLYQDSLRAEIDTSQIKEEGTEKILSIKLLPFFGAQNNKSEGYILTGNGSGAVIDFNNGKTVNVSPYRVQVGGVDPVIPFVQQQNVSEKTQLPLYGLQVGKQGLLAISDEGNARAYINAAVSGLQTSYNQAYFEYELRTSQLSTIGDSKSSNSREVVTYDTSPLAGKLGVRYFFLGEEEQGLAGMAAVTRRYLATEESEASVQETPPVYFSVLGGIRQKTSVLAFHVEKNTALTTLKQADSMMDYFHSQNVKGIRLLYDGWSNAQLKGMLTENIDLWRGLGTVSELQALQDKLNKNNGKIYLQSSFVQYKRAGNGFSLNKGTIKDLNKSVVEQPVYKRSTFFPDTDADPARFLQSGRVPSLINAFGQNLQKRRLSVGLMPKDYVNLLYSDFGQDGLNRDQMADLMTTTIWTQSKQTVLAAETPFFRSVFAFSDIVSVPEATTEYPLVDRSVPFYQMVLHGVRPYCLRPINADGDSDRMFLLGIAQGACPHYELAAQNLELLKDVQQDSYYGANYMAWRDVIAAQYQRYATVWEKTNQAAIVSYTVPQKDVIQTVYDNGVYTLVNLGKDPVVVNGVEIASRDFVMGER